jgi:predicted DsbA family dithiol-disulfide isomerase
LAAAGFAEAAAAQELFWAMHELLFHRQKALGESDLFAYACQVGLDEARLRDDLERDELSQHVREDATSALAAARRGRRRSSSTAGCTRAAMTTAPCGQPSTRWRRR